MDTKPVAFTAFYPSRPFWAGSKVNFDVPKTEGWFHDQMVEEVYSRETDSYAIKVCRDGRILIRISALECDEPVNTVQPIEKIVQRWGDYLDYLNAFYLLLDSATLEIDNFAYFNLHEITNRDAFRVTYENGKSTGENIAIESIASTFQMGRYSGSYRPELPIEFDSKIMMRHVISLNAITLAGTLFEKVIFSPGMEKPLSSFAKSVAEYKVGNYETSLILAWFITEASMSRLWESHIDSLNCELAGGRRRINRERKDFLTGRDFSISIVSNMLELFDVLNRDLFEDIDTVRGYRNKIVHARNFTAGAAEAQLSMKTALSMIERLWKIRLTASFGYSVTGI